MTAQVISYKNNNTTSASSVTPKTFPSTPLWKPSSNAIPRPMRKGFLVIVKPKSSLRTTSHRWIGYWANAHPPMTAMWTGKCTRISLILICCHFLIVLSSLLSIRDHPFPCCHYSIRSGRRRKNLHKKWRNNSPCRKYTNWKFRTRLRFIQVWKRKIRPVNLISTLRKHPSISTLTTNWLKKSTPG